MIKHQVLIIFLIIVVAAWIAFRLNERRKTRENQEDDLDKPEEI